MPHGMWNHSSPTGIESALPAVEAQSLHQWTASEVPEFVISNEGFMQVENWPTYTHHIFADILAEARKVRAQHCKANFTTCPGVNFCTQEGRVTTWWLRTLEQSVGTRKKAKWNKWSILTRIDQKPFCAPIHEENFPKGGFVTTRGNTEWIWWNVKNGFVLLDLFLNSSSFFSSSISFLKERRMVRWKVWALGLIWVQILFCTQYLWKH